MASHFRLGSSALAVFDLFSFLPKVYFRCVTFEAGSGLLLQASDREVIHDGHVA